MNAQTAASSMRNSPPEKLRKDFPRTLAKAQTTFALTSGKLRATALPRRRGKLNACPPYVRDGSSS